MDLKCMKQLRKVLTFHSILRVLWAILGKRSNLPKKIAKKRVAQNSKGFPSLNGPRAMLENLGQFIL